MESGARPQYGRAMLHPASPRFTDRQREVVRLIALGLSNDEIAAAIGISPRTAKAHSDLLRTKLQVPRKRQIPAAYRALTGEDPHSLQSLERPPPGHDDSCPPTAAP